MTARAGASLAASVLLCTCNRGAKLEACLAALAAQSEPAQGEFEVLVVDNNSSDDTRNIVAAYVERLPRRFRYLFEPRQGKSNALNLALSEARGEIFLMLDDDCLAAPDWVSCMLAEFDADPGLDAAGGRILLHDPADFPVTLRTSEVRTELRSTAQLFSLIAGCNFAVRRTLVERLGTFDPLLGPGSPRHLVAEDIDFIYRAFRNGARIAYIPTPCVAHDHGRRTESAVAALQRSYVEGRGAFYAKHILQGHRDVLKMAYWEITGCLRDAFRPPLTRARANVRIIVQLLRGMAARLLDELPWSRRKAHRD